MKINTSIIEGYESMSAEEKLAALEALELPDPDYTGFVKKELLEKANSEAAGYKKQLRERMSEEEAAKAKAAEELASAMEELEHYRAKDAINEYTTQFMSIGYNAELAKSTAQAIQKGDMAAMFKNHAKFVEDQKKALKAELLKDTPAPPAGDPTKVVNKEAFSKMTLLEKQQFAKENPEQYKELYGGN